VCEKVNKLNNSYFYVYESDANLTSYFITKFFNFYYNIYLAKFFKVNFDRLIG